MKEFPQLFPMPDYRIKLHAYLSAPDRPVWNAPLEHLACLNNLPLTRSELTKLHGIASSSDRLNLRNNGQPSTTASHPISGQKHSVESTVKPIEIPLEIQTEPDPEKVFWWFWRFYPDRLRQKTPDFLLHRPPRLPNSQLPKHRLRPLWKPHRASLPIPI